MDAAWDELLDKVGTRPGMYVLAPRFHGVVAYFEGFSHGRNDGVMHGFTAWFNSHADYMVDHGEPDSRVFQCVMTDRRFGKRPQDLTNEEDLIAIADLCLLIHRYLRDIE